MKYRRFNNLGWDASILGFGVMQLPIVNGDSGSIDEAESIKMIQYGIDHGVNYLDSGYPFVMEQHECRARFISQALQNDYRRKVKVSATLPTFLVQSSQDFDLFLDQQLSWLGMGSVDFYVLGRLNRESWPKLQELGVIQWAEKAIVDGRIGKLGFSFHDEFQTLRSILGAYDDWALGQFRFSFMDIDHHPGVGGIKYAAEQGLAVVISEPFLGGRLIKTIPDSVAEIWASAPQERSLVEWGFRWAWNYPEVTLVVSDMSSIAQVVENVALADDVEADGLSIQEEIVIGRVRDAYRKLRAVSCTACRCCMPCPVDIDVPRIFEIYNDAIMYGDVNTGRFLYSVEGHRADKCTGCGACENDCPKNFAIINLIKEAHELLAGK